MDSLPFISVLIVSYNEENYIAKCLNSLIEQTYPKKKYEIIIIDSGSTDNTLSIAKKIVNDYKRTLIRDDEKNNLEFKFLNNPHKRLASGWNLGIKKSKGLYVVRIDGHAYADNDFLLESIKIP